MRVAACVIVTVTVNFGVISRRELAASNHIHQVQVNPIVVVPVGKHGRPAEDAEDQQRSDHNKR